MLRARFVKRASLIAAVVGVAAWAAYSVAATVYVDPTAIAEAGRTHTLGTASASNGAQTLVVWVDYRKHDLAAASDIYATRIDDAGTVIDAPSIEVNSAIGLQSAPSVSFGGGVWLVTWMDERAGNRDVYAARVNGSVRLTLLSFG